VLVEGLLLRHNRRTAVFWNGSPERVCAGGGAVRCPGRVTHPRATERPSTTPTPVDLP